MAKAKHHAKPTPSERRPVADSLALEDLEPVTPAEKAHDAKVVEALTKPKATPQVIVPSAFVYINNDTSHTATVPVPVAVTEDGTILHENFMLYPGVNEVPAHKWAAALKQVMVAMHVESGSWFEVPSIGELTDKKALEVVDLTVQKSLLTKWLESEKRANVVVALKAQLEKIAPTKAKAEER